MNLFKVLVDGKSCHGGDLAWSLPKDGCPGEWQEVEGDISLCSRGLHLTDWIASWWKPGCTAYVVEAEGVEGTCGDESRKVVARRVRLMREATQAELEASGVFSAGVHEAKGNNKFVAYDSSTVTAYDRSTVEAYDSSTVTAYGSSTVTAYDSSTVTARDSSTVISWWGSPAVKIADNAVHINRVDIRPTVFTSAGELK